MWEELATAENLDAKLWPRLAAIAERLWSPESVTDTNAMYARLEPTNRWLEWSGLTQRSNLELMRQRLAGLMPYQALDEFASVLEPIKGYARHAKGYTSFTPFNRLVDSIPPESDAAREFRDAVDAYLAAPQDHRDSRQLRQHLTEWASAVQQVRPMLQTNSLLTEDVPVADSLASLCEIAQRALDYLDRGPSDKAAENWKQQALRDVQKDSMAQADMLIQIAPGVQKLVEAVPVASPGI